MPHKCQRGAFVVVVGPDGVGKTTLAAALISRAAGETGYFHFMPPIGGALAAGPPSNPPPPPPKRDDAAGLRLLGILRLARNVVRSWIGYWSTLRPALARGALVVGDRWSYGYLVQPAPLRFYGPNRLAHWAIRAMPRPDLVVNLAAPPEVVRSRKQELTVDQINRELDQWRDLDEPLLRTFDATQSPEHNADLVTEQLASTTEAGRYKSFPPGMGHIMVPVSSRKAAQSAMAMYAACKPKTVIAQRLALRAVGVFGPHILPSRTRSWTPPVSDHTWCELQARWHAEAGEYDAVAVHERRQGARLGFAALLIKNGAATAFVKVTSTGDEAVGREAQALTLVEGAAPDSFRAPRLISTGQCGGWSYLLTSAFTGRHVPASAPEIDRITSEISQALTALPRPEGTPSAWRPMHGDLTPWNLRQVGDDVMLTDWEEAAWGPVGADATLYAATDAALRSGLPTANAPREAVDYWLSHLRRGEQHREDREMLHRTTAALEHMREGAQ